MSQSHQVLQSCLMQASESVTSTFVLNVYFLKFPLASFPVKEVFLQLSIMLVCSQSVQFKVSLREVSLILISCSPDFCSMQVTVSFSCVELVRSRYFYLS